MHSSHSTHYGTFRVKTYEDNFKAGAGKLGIEMELAFWVNPRRGQGEFALIQVVSAEKYMGNTWVLYDSGAENRDYGYVDLAGRAWLDSSGDPCPAFGVSKAPEKGIHRGFLPREMVYWYKAQNWGEIGYWDGFNKAPAALLDTPSRTRNVAFRHRFETAVIVTRGTDIGRCFGVINWGYSGGPNGGPVLDELVTSSTPSDLWQRVVRSWNGFGGTEEVPLDLI